MKRIALPAHLDLAAASDLADKLRAATSALVLDGSAVERVGVCGLQLLLSATLHGNAHGRLFELAQPSDALCAAARTAGADAFLATTR